MARPDSYVLSPLFEHRRVSDLLVTPSGGAQMRLADVLSAALTGGLPVGTTPGTVAAGDDRRITGAVQAAGGDASATTALATASTAPRTLAARFADRLNARDFGTDGPALSACALAALTAGKDMYVPPGNYAVSATAPFTLQPGVAVYLDSRATILGDSAGQTTPIVSNFGQAGSYTIIGGTFRGMADTLRTEAGAMIHVYFADVVLFEDVTVRYSRLFSLLIDKCNKGTIRGCHVYRSLADSCAIWDTPDFTITGNLITGSNDDSISAHTRDATAVARAGGTVAHNTVVDGQGIRVLGAKAVNITSNVLRRVNGPGIEVGGNVGAAQGDTPGLAIKITNNNLTDVFNRPEPNPRNNGGPYINLVFGQRRAGGGGAAPGDPTPSTGVSVPLLGTLAGNLYTQSQTGPMPGSYFVDVSGNTLVRTKPAVAAYADWAVPAPRWIGDSNAPAANSNYSGPVPESCLAIVGIFVGGTMRQSRIANNVIRTKGTACILFGSGVAQGDFDGLDIADNDLSDFSTAGIMWQSGSATSQKMRIRGNVFNGDPEFGAANRGVGGTWQADGMAPWGVYGATLNGVTYSGNVFENVTRPIQRPGTMALEVGNILRGNITAFGSFSTSNVGIGGVPVLGPGWQYVQHDADPRSATYGQILSAPIPPPISAPGGTLTAETVIAPPGAGSCLRLSNGTYGISAFIDNLNYYLLLTPSGSPLAGFNGLRPFTVSLSTGLVSLANGLSVSGPVAQPVVELASASTITTNAALGNSFAVALQTNATLANPTNLAPGSYCWLVAQDGTGGRTLAYGNKFKWPGGVVPTLSTAANAVDVISAISDGASLFAVLSKAFG